MTASPRPRASDRPTTTRADCYADLVEQLFSEYESALSLCRIVEVVNQCRHDLSGSPTTAMPELLERLARCRLSELAEQAARQQ